MVYWNSSEDAIRRLESELYEARRTVLSLLPEPIEKLLSGYYSCNVRQESYRWERDVADAIIQQATLLPPTPYGSDRAYCPLCKEGSSGPYKEGFAVPGGLRRHLLGEGNTFHCRVMKAALSMARDHWNDKFRLQEEEEERRRQATLRQRREVEVKYVIAPEDPPCLVDEDLFGNEARTPDELLWAEDRLKELGFTLSVDGVTKTWTRETDDVVIFADHRTRGHIEFRVYKKPPPKRGRRRGTIQMIRIQDSWKHDIKQKFDVRLADAIQLLFRT